MLQDGTIRTGGGRGGRGSQHHSLNFVDRIEELRIEYLN